MTSEAAAERIRTLTNLLEGTDIGLLELTTPGETVRLRRDERAGPQPASPAQSDVGGADAPGPLTVKAPSVGVFRRAHPMHDEALARPGQDVRAGEAVGLIEVSALLVHVTAPRDGVVLDVLAEDGDVVGYGAPLVRLAGKAWR